MKICKPIMIGSLKKYRIIHPETIAKAMKILAQKNIDKEIFSSDEIETIVKESK